jgi:hypothetical protein
VFFTGGGLNFRMVNLAAHPKARPLGIPVVKTYYNY